MKQISIITINYNNKAGLQKTINSVVSQSLKDFEFIVIDGDSDDGSKDLLTQYQAHITYAVSEPDTGIYNAMNKGIALAHGEYLLFLNSGDCLTNTDVLAIVSKQLDGTAIVYGDIITEDAGRKQKYEKSPAVLNVQHFMISTLWHPAAFIQKKIFETYGLYDERYKVAADYEFFVRTIVRHNICSRHIDLPVAIFELNGISNDPKFFNAMVKERKQVQTGLFTRPELEELRLLEIKLLGRRSKFFNLVPGNKLLENLYDKFYHRWYQFRMNHK